MTFKSLKCLTLRLCCVGRINLTVLAVQTDTLYHFSVRPDTLTVVVRTQSLKSETNEKSAGSTRKQHLSSLPPPPMHPTQPPPATCQVPGDRASGVWSWRGLGGHLLLRGPWALHDALPPRERGWSGLPVKLSAAGQQKMGAAPARAQGPREGPVLQLPSSEAGAAYPVCASKVPSTPLSLKALFSKGDVVSYLLNRIIYLGEGNGNPLRHSCPENSMDRGAWQATVHGVAKSQTGLSNFHFTSFFTLVKHS